MRYVVVSGELPPAGGAGAEMGREEPSSSPGSSTPGATLSRPMQGCGWAWRCAWLSSAPDPTLLRRWMVDWAAPLLLRALWKLHLWQLNLKEEGAEMPWEAGRSPICSQASFLPTARALEVDSLQLWWEWARVEAGVEAEWHRIGRDGTHSWWHWRGGVCRCVPRQCALTNVMLVGTWMIVVTAKRGNNMGPLNNMCN